MQPMGNNVPRRSATTTRTYFGSFFSWNGCALGCHPAFELMELYGGGDRDRTEMECNKAKCLVKILNLGCLLWNATKLLLVTILGQKLKIDC